MVSKPTSSTTSDTNLNNVDENSHIDGIPSPAEQQSLMALARRILNPNGDNPRVDEYITATFSYISSALFKVATSGDREKATKEIVEDLKTRFDAWKVARKQEEEEKQRKEEDLKSKKKLEELDLD